MTFLLQLLYLPASILSNTLIREQGFHARYTTDDLIVDSANLNSSSSGNDTPPHHWDFLNSFHNLILNYPTAWIKPHCFSLNGRSSYVGSPRFMSSPP